MKNIILGAIGLLVTVYVTMIGMNVYMIQTHKDQLENCFSRILQQALEEGYGTVENEMITQRIISDFAESMNNEGALQVEIQAMDLQKGLLSVRVTESFFLLNGKEKVITLEKTIIMDRLVLNEDRVKVTFMVGEDVYKVYELTKGEKCQLPVAPQGSFLGWMKQGDISKTVVSEIGNVWEDQVYVALTE